MRDKGWWGRPGQNMEEAGFSSEPWGTGHEQWLREVFGKMSGQGVD